MNAICGFSLQPKQAEDFAKAIIDRYNEGIHPHDDNFKYWENGVGPAFTNDIDNDILSQNCLPVQHPPATAFNDLYKWTMMPIIIDMERHKTNNEEQNPILNSIKYILL